MNKIKLYGLIIVIFTTLLSLIPTISYGAVVTGHGTENSPYVIDMDAAVSSSTMVTIDGHQVTVAEIPLEIEVKKEGFWFKFKGSETNCKGTYFITFDKNEKKVTFIKINGDNLVITSDNKYFQAGITVPETYTGEDTFSDATFTIKTLEKEKGAKFWGLVAGRDQKYTLKNAPRPREIGGESTLSVPDPSCFVFVKSDITAESAYKELSEDRFGSDNIKYSNVDGGVADLKLYSITDPAGTRIGEFVVRFGKYRTINVPSSIHSQDSHKLEIKYQFVPAEDPTAVEKAGVIETAITWILIAVGEVFMFVIKLFLGNSVTIDAIIFNRYDAVIIDLRGLVGPYANDAVKGILNATYNGFQILAIAINLVILLYIGVQIIMSSGTDKQSKYVKNIQNWIVGVMILFLAPQLFPFLTDITNGIVSYIGKDTQPMYTQYNILALLDDEDLLGENAQTVDLEKKIKEKIEGNTEQIAEKQQLIAEKQAEIDQKRAEMESKKNEMEAKQAEIESKLSDTDAKKTTLDAYDAHMDRIISDFVNSPSFSGGTYTAEEFTERMDFSRYISDMLTYVEMEKRDWDEIEDERVFQEKLDEYRSVWNLFDYEFRPNCNCPDEVRDFSYHGQHSLECNREAVYPIRTGARFVTEIKNLQLEAARLEEEVSQLQVELAPYIQLQNEIDDLMAEIEMLVSYQTQGEKADLMSTMRANAGKTGRVIYALVWLILIFQMVTLLAMYYKRIIMVAILIMIFPIVMITYAIDKIGDGAAQTLENWTKEFTINILVQVAHAVIYVTLIQTGLDIYAANQDNWLFLLVAVLFLFPGERLLRSIFGMNGSTIGSLKANVGGAMAAGVMAGKAAFKLGKGAAKGAKSVHSLAKNIKTDGFKTAVGGRLQYAKKSIKNSWQNLGKEKDKANEAKDKKRQSVADRKKRARDTNIERRRKQMENASGAKKAMLGAVNAASHVRNGMYHIGNAGRKVRRGFHKAQKSVAGKTFRAAGATLKGIRKVGGATVGISSGVTSALTAAGTHGLSAGIMQGVQQGKAVGQLVGGPSAKPKEEKKEPKDRSQNGNTPVVKTRGHMPGGQKYKRAKTPAAAGKKREGVPVVGKTSRKIRGTRKVNKTVNKKRNVKETNS